MKNTSIVSLPLKSKFAPVGVSASFAVLLADAFQTFAYTCTIDVSKACPVLAVQVHESLSAVEYSAEYTRFVAWIA